MMILQLVLILVFFIASGYPIPWHEGRTPGNAIEDHETNQSAKRAVPLSRCDYIIRDCYERQQTDRQT